MSSPLADLLAWIQDTPGASAFVASRGPWVESDANRDKRLLCLIAQGGAGPDVAARFQRVRVLILGKRGERNTAGALLELENFANALVGRTLTDYKKGCLTQIRAIADILGPGYTTEDRPWWELNFELII